MHRWGGLVSSTREAELERQCVPAEHGQTPEEGDSGGWRPVLGDLGQSQGYEHDTSMTYSLQALPAQDASCGQHVHRGYVRHVWTHGHFWIPHLLQ